MPRDIEHEIAALEEAIIKLTRQYRAQLERRQCCTAFRSGIKSSGFDVVRMEQAVDVK